MNQPPSLKYPMLPRTWCDGCHRVSTHLPLASRLAVGWTRKEEFNLCPRCSR